MKISRVKMAAIGRRYEGRAPGAGIVAAPGAFDLDDVGAEIGEDLSGPGAGQNAGKFEDAQSSQGARHDQLHKPRGRRRAGA
jgi:hypothetical protein